MATRLPTIAGDSGGLSRYLEEIRKFPMLEPGEEFMLAKGCRLATYAMWWIRASIQEYILRSWSLVKMGTTAAQKKLFFNLRRMKGQLKALEDGDTRPDQAKKTDTKQGGP